MKQTGLDWIQVGILVAAIVGVGGSYYSESRRSYLEIEHRFSRLEQRMDDADKDRIEMLNSLYRIESKLK